MRATFEKQEFNQEVISDSKYFEMFQEMGFSASKVEICFTNGCSAYVTVIVNVVNEKKMFADNFVYDGKCTLTVRVSDHASNLERVCGGVSGNKVSLAAFRRLIETGAIK